MLHGIVVMCNFTVDYQNSHFTFFGIKIIKKRELTFNFENTTVSIFFF